MVLLVEGIDCVVVSCGFSTSRVFALEITPIFPATYDQKSFPAYHVRVALKRDNYYRLIVGRNARVVI